MLIFKVIHFIAFSCFTDILPAFDNLAGARSYAKRTRDVLNFFKAFLALFYCMVSTSLCLNAQTAYNGYLDYAGCGSISGWALDWNRLETAISVNINDGGNTVASDVLAANYRPDLNTGGDAQIHNKGFVVGTPASLLNGRLHQIFATYENSGINLFNTPIPLECHAYNGYVDSATLDVISGWALDWNDIENPITVDIYDGDTLVLTGVVANTYRPDL